MALTSSRIEYAADQPPSFVARWASRLVFFCAFLLIAALFLHRVFGLATPVAMNIALMAFIGAATALVLAAVAGADIWVTGRQGAARVVVSSVMSLALLAIPAGLLILSRDWPRLNDVSTDTENPPAFVKIAALRPADANPITYRKDDFASIQKAGYPDLKTLAVPRSADDTFDVVLQALTKLKLKPVSEVVPSDAPNGAGLIEISDRTMVLGFRDDVVIRVAGNETAAKIDVRSSSRYGRSDFGRNAERVRGILREIVARLEATVPSAAGQKNPAAAKKAGSKKPLVKRPEAVGRPSTGGQPRSSPSRPATRRGPEQSE